MPLCNFLSPNVYNDNSHDYSSLWEHNGLLKNPLILMILTPFNYLSEILQIFWV